MHQHKAFHLTRSLIVFLGASLGLGLGSALPLQAQSYPGKPVRIIVGVPPGGFTDSVARFITPKLVETLGQQFTVENRTGASGIIAVEAAMKSTNDGYTLLMSTNAEMAVNPHVLAKIPYDPLRDFVPIVPALAPPKPEPAATVARSSPAIELQLAGAMLRIVPGTDTQMLTMVLRAIRASAA